MYQNFIGIDISKADFYVAQYGETTSKSFDNNINGFKKFYKQNAKAIVDALVVLETTGGHEMALIRFLCSKNIIVHRADTRKVKYFIRSLGVQAKSDAIDAHGLAKYGRERHETLLPFVPPSENKLQLQQLMQRRIDLVKSLAAEKNRRQAPNINDWVKKNCAQVIAFLQEQIDSLNEKINQLLDAEPSSKEKLNVLQEVDGIGDVLSKSLLVLLPELGMISRRKIASLSGLAPHPYESGKKIAYRRTKGGRSDVRSILFMGAMSASRSKGRLGQFYRGLIARAKKKMVALVALMRKMLVIANAKMTEWYQQENCKVVINE